MSDLAYAHPGGEELFRAVSFRVPAGVTVGLVGGNGVGKSTLLRLLAGVLEPAEGAIHIDGSALYMAQDVGVTDELQVRDLLHRTLPSHLAHVASGIATAELELAAGDTQAGVRLGERLGEWSDLGGYQLEAAWDEACRRVLGCGYDELTDRPVATLSGGERKRLVLEVLFASESDVLLLDEPDNHLDIAAKALLEQRLAATPKTVLLVSHDRDLLAAAPSAIITLEGNGAWWHGGSYATYAEARDARQARFGDARRRWQDEERRLRDLTRTFKERARYSADWAKPARAMETRWKRWLAEGPPPAPVLTPPVVMRIRGGDSARRVIQFRGLALDGLVKPFDEEVYFGERVGLIGPNGTGKSHLLRLLAGEPLPYAGEWSLGPRVQPGLFTQHNQRQQWRGQTPLQLVQAHTGQREKALEGLARYGLIEAAHRPSDLLSGGQRARLEILSLELAGDNLLLLDEPTDNLDITSAEALEQALESFTGTVVAVSHDRAFLRTLDRFLHLGHDGALHPVPDLTRALELLLQDDRPDARR